MVKNHKPSAFDRSVYRELERIPRGRVTTYGELARAIGCGSARAVGQALARNPDAPRVPCHRVVRRDGDLGGYQGAGAGAGIERKRALLRDEGVVFRGVRRVDLAASGMRLEGAAAQSSAS